jgi:hypothetical protein
MLAPIVSALAAATLAAAPVSYGSEPYPFAVEESPVLSQTRVAQGTPTLATALGSEPFLAGAGDMPSARAPGSVSSSRRPGVVTAATSLGSEPFVLETRGEGAVPAPRQEPGAGQRLARACTCR